MSITLADINQFKQQLLVFEQMMTPLEFTLVDTQAKITCPAHVGIRSTGSPMRNSVASTLTGGVDQDSMVCVIFYDHWEAVSPSRKPKKGDVVEKDDMLYSIVRVISTSPGGVPMVYKAELKGG